MEPARSRVAHRAIPPGQLRRVARRTGRAPGRSRGPYFAAQFDLARPEIQRKLDLVETLSKIAADADCPMAHMAVAFTLAHPAVTSAIIGPRRVEQLDDLLAGTNVRLDAAALDAIDEIVPPGTLVDENDRGFMPWWFEPASRRRG